MEALVLELSPATYQLLLRRAHQEGKAPEKLSGELLEHALQSATPATPSPRDVLQAAGLLRSLGPTLRRKARPDVTLEEVRDALNRAEGPPLSEIILAQRGTIE